MQAAILKKEKKRQNTFIMSAGCSEADNRRQCWTKSFTISLCTLQDIGIHGEATMQYASWMEDFAQPLLGSVLLLMLHCGLEMMTKSAL